MTWRPRNVPQCGHAWCGGFGLLHWGQGTSVIARSARWLRRSPCAARGIRFLGWPAKAFSSRGFDDSTGALGGSALRMELLELAQLAPALVDRHIVVVRFLVQVSPTHQAEALAG